MEQYAPIVLFTYNRLSSVKHTVEMLEDNELANESRLVIYSDGPRKTGDEEQISVVRQYIHNIQGFRCVEVIERVENWGLARNIIDGVTSVVNKYGKVIVLEDDIETSRFFLRYMNDALRLYEDNKKVLQIGGYTYPFDKKDVPEVFFLKKPDCLGWAIWKDRWKLFNKNTEELINSVTRKDIYRINIDGKSYYWGQVLDNFDGTLNTWAIYLHVLAYMKDMIVLYSRTAVSRVDTDEIGEHGQVAKIYDAELADSRISGYPELCKVNEKAENSLEKVIEQLEPVDKSLVSCIRECSKIFDNRDIALWGMGRMGKMIFQEMCSPDMQKYEVKCFDSYKKCYNNSYELKDKADRFFVIITVLNGYEEIANILNGYGYKENKDYICFGKLYK